MLGRFAWQILFPGFLGTCESWKDYCCLSWEEHALSSLGSSVCAVMFILAQALQASSIALARHSFMESSTGEQAFGDLFVPDLVQETMCLIHFFLVIKWSKDILFCRKKQRDQTKNWSLVILFFKLENIDYLDLQNRSQQAWDWNIVFNWEYFLC